MALLQALFGEDAELVYNNHMLKAFIQVVLQEEVNGFVAAAL
jgi:hypothetical protein